MQADRNHAREVGLSIREDDDSSRGIPESVLTPHGTVVAPGSAAGGGPVTALHMSDNTAQRDREALR